MATCRHFTVMKERLPASEMACLRKIKTLGSVQNKSCFYLCVVSKPPGTQEAGRLQTKIFQLRLYVVRHFYFFYVQVTVHRVKFL